MTGIFRRCFNRIGAYTSLRLAMGTACTRAKGGANISYPHCGEASYFIAKEAVTLTGTMYPPPPERGPK